MPSAWIDPTTTTCLCIDRSPGFPCCTDAPGPLCLSLSLPLLSARPPPFSLFSRISLPFTPSLQPSWHEACFYLAIDPPCCNMFVKTTALPAYQVGIKKKKKKNRLCCHYILYTLYIYRQRQRNTLSRYCKSFVFVPSTHSWTAVILLPQVSPQASLKYLLNLTDLFTVRGHYLYPLLVFMTTSNAYAREQLIHTREQRSSINRLRARHFLTYTSAVGCLVYRFLIQRHKLN